MERLTGDLQSKRRTPAQHTSVTLTTGSGTGPLRPRVTIAPGSDRFRTGSAFGTRVRFGLDPRQAL